MNLRALAPVVVVVAAAACSKKSEQRRPALTREMRDHMAVLASSCEDRTGPPDTDKVLTCVSPDDPNRARVDAFLVEGNRVDQLMITLREPSVEAAAAKLAPALAGFVDDKARDAILDKLRVTTPEAGYSRVDTIGPERDAVVYVKPLEVGGFDVTLQLMFGPP